jgi:alpha-L-rhamnosidase
VSPATSGTFPWPPEGAQLTATAYVRTGPRGARRHGGAEPGGRCTGPRQPSDTGQAGTKALLPALTEQGQVDLAFAVATQRTYPSWGYWVDNGATTLWEAWETNTRSRDHAFLGSIEGWLYRELAGIKPAAPGYARIAIRPHLPAGLDHVSASVRTVRGTVASRWNKPDSGLRLAVTIPANAMAQVSIPATSPDDVTEGQRPATEAEGVRFVRMDGDRAVFDVGSGTYHFGTELSTPTVPG